MDQDLDVEEWRQYNIEQLSEDLAAEHGYGEKSSFYLGRE